MIGAGGCSSGAKTTSGSDATMDPTSGSVTVSTTVSTTAVSQAATAVAGDEFCRLSTAARVAGNAVNTSETDPAVLKPEVEAALAASKAATAAAPADFAEIGKNSVAQQEAVIALLEQYDYSFTAAVTSAEGKAFFSDPDYAAVKKARDAYLEQHCDLQPSDSGSSNGGISLSPGDEGIRQLFQLLQIGGQVQITDDQIECLVGELSGKITDADLRAIGSGQPVSGSSSALFVAAIGTCGVVLAAG